MACAAYARRTACVKLPTRNQRARTRTATAHGTQHTQQVLVRETCFGSRPALGHGEITLRNPATTPRTNRVVVVEEGGVLDVGLALLLPAVLPHVEVARVVAQPATAARRALASVRAPAVCMGRQRAFGRQACPPDACAACGIVAVRACIRVCSSPLRFPAHALTNRRRNQPAALALRTGRLCSPRRPRPPRTSSGSTSACCTGTSCRARAGRPG